MSDTAAINYTSLELKPMGCDSALLKSLPRFLLRFTPSDHFEGNLDIVLPDYIRTYTLYYFVVHRQMNIPNWYSTTGIFIIRKRREEQFAGQLPVRSVTNCFSR